MAESSPLEFERSYRERTLKPRKVVKLDLNCFAECEDSVFPIPSEVAEMVNVRQLFINPCYADPHDALASLKNVRTLTIYNECRRSAHFPLLQAPLPKLRYLRVDGALDDFPNWPNPALRLEEAYVKPVHLVHLPPSIAAAPRLRILVLEAESLTVLPGHNCWVNELERLELAATAIRIFPPELSNLRSLRYLTLPAHPPERFPGVLLLKQSLPLRNYADRDVKFGLSRIIWDYVPSGLFRHDILEMWSGTPDDCEVRSAAPFVRYIFSHDSTVIQFFDHKGVLRQLRPTKEGYAQELRPLGCERIAPGRAFVLREWFTQMSLPAAFPCRDGRHASRDERHASRAPDSLRSTAQRAGALNPGEELKGALRLECDVSNFTPWRVDITISHASSRHTFVGRYREWYPNGQKRTEGRYHRDHAEGRWTQWHENGALMGEADYRFGLEHGRFARYFATGQLQIEGSYRHGRQHGRWVRHYENGTLMTEAIFDNGAAQGAVETFYADGTLMNRGHYHKGLLHGPWESWYATGHKESQIEFAHGRALTRTLWDEKGQQQPEPEAR
jgi:antitoxin component YwqK of YwqJK toxin-antitoxin module